MHGLENHIYVAFTICRYSFQLGVFSLILAILPHLQKMHEAPVILSGPKLLGVRRALPPPPKKSLLTIPCHTAQLQLHRVADGAVSPAPGQTSPLEQVWADS